MRFYPKKLHSIKDLEREKRRLQKEVKLLEEEDFFSLKGSKKSKDDDDDDDGGGSWIDLLPISNPLVKSLLPLAQGLFAASSRKKQKQQFTAGEEKNGKNILLTIGKDVLMSYLKWKAIELSYKGIKVIVKKRKEKRAAAQAE